jgi:hypothetical protein
MNKSMKIYWLIPVIILSGIFGFYMSSYSFFKFKNEIDIVSLFSLVATTALGIYIASTLQNNIEAKKFEKSLNQNLINSLLSKTKTIDKYLSSNNLKFQETIALFKSLSSLLSELREINEICKVSDCDKITELRTLFSEIKPLITGGNVNNEKLNLTIEHKGLSKTKLKEFRAKLIELMIDTNRK